MTTIIVLGFVIATTVQILYWVVLFRQLAYYEEPGKLLNAENELDVSVIICARNEAENLKKNLPRILSQNYRSYEVIVVNDNSTDQTAEVLWNFQTIYPNLHSILVKNKKIIGKKGALAKGILAAQFNTLLLTDADCFPTNDNWIREMQKCIRGTKEIGLGYGPYVKEKGWLNRFIRYETVFAAVHYLSFSLAGMTYMGVGRNLIYQKSLFTSKGGFKKHQHIASGDDDLFINNVAKPNNVAVRLHPSTFIYSSPKQSWKAFFQQKGRHLTTAKHYKKRDQFLLGLSALTHFLHYFFGVLLLILKFSTVFVLILYIARIFILFFYNSLILKKVKERDLLKFIPVLDLMYVLYYVLFTPTLIIGKTKSWK